jgi:PIN domain nuclease of toxin-antitoxin system
MSYLMDTHALVWWLNGDDRFPEKLRIKLFEEQPSIWISSISFWEISIKRSLGKWLDLALPTSSLWLEAKAQGLEFLQISPSHLIQLEKLPLHHRDPFDRLLIAQAQVENLTILTVDEQFRNYEVASHWG